MGCRTPGSSVLHYLTGLAHIHVHQVRDTIQPSHCLLSSSPFDFNLSQHQGIFQWVDSLHQVAQILELSFSNSLSNEYSGLISYKIDCFDLLAVQGTLKSFFQHHNSKASILQCSVLYAPTLTSVHDYWKNSIFDYMNLSQQSDVSAF